MEYTDLFRDKTYNGTLNIKQDKIVLDTDLDYNKIEIHYTIAKLLITISLFSQ